MTTIAQAIGQEFERKGMQTKALDIAKNMLSTLHLDMQLVQQDTGLSEEELIKIQEEAKR